MCQLYPELDGRQKFLQEGIHTKSRIREVKGGDIRKQLRAGNVVVVAGFQGISDSGDLTTFGRGGSDLSAIALAGSLRAKSCQIYTDVEGVYTADPDELCLMPAKYKLSIMRRCLNLLVVDRK